MAFAAAVMSTSAGHKAFIRSPSHDEILDSYSQHHQHHHQHPATPPRNEPIGTTTTPPSQSSLSSSSSSRRLAVLPRSTSNNSNLNATMNSPDSNYISQFNTSLSSFKPRSPPGMHSNNAMPESPHMIRCSTCNSLVPLLELSDHVCRPSVTSSSSTTTSTSAIPLHNPRQPSQPSQHARLASGFNHNAPSPPSMSNYPAPAQPALREMLNPLRVNVSQAEQRNGQPLEAPLPTPYRTPLPRSPSDHTHTPSPGASPTGTLPPHLSPSYPFAHHDHHHHTAQSSGISDSVDLSAENNAGIGARMPFYERLQQERAFSQSQQQPTSPSYSSSALSTTLSPSSSPQYHNQQQHRQYHSPPISARSIQEQPLWAKRLETPEEYRSASADIPKSPISPGWSGLADEEPDILSRKSEESHYIEEEEDDAAAVEAEEVEEEKVERGERHVASAGPVSRLQQQQKKNYQYQNQHHHIRETSDSGQSSAALSNSYSDHLDYFINDGSTPETSPEFPETPLFKDNNEQQFPSLHEEDYGRQIRRTESENNDEEYEGYDDDIIDSYPTPQPGFSGRFGGLVIDDGDDALDAYHRSQAPPVVSEERERHGRLAPSPEPVAACSPLFRAHSDRSMQEPSRFLNDRPLGKGIPASHSTPNNLARLASIDTSVAGQATGPSRRMDESAIPFNGRRRLHSNASSGHISPSAQGNELNRAHQNASPAIATTPTEENGLRLDACLDDLMKEMNRESIETVPAGSTSKALKSPLSNDSEQSATPTSPEARSLPISFQREEETKAPALTRKDIQCDSCNQIIKIGNPVERDGQCFCNECYAQLYLPKCRKCRLPIEDKAIGSGDGKVKGKFHIGCFSCFSCSAPFPTGDFYVFANRPYCAQHYHERNGTLCANPACSEEQRGIEGPCVSLVGEESGNGGRYHPTCFRCSEGSCLMLLDQYHYVISGLPYCEQHAREIEDRDSAPMNSPSPSPTRTPVGESDDFYDARHGVSASKSNVIQQKRRSASLDIPVQSLNALRKNAQAPSYRGMLARRRSSARRRPSESSGNVNGWEVNGRNQLPMQQPARMVGVGYNAGPPPVSRTRRAEKRRTVISQIRLH